MPNGGLSLVPGIQPSPVERIAGEEASAARVRHQRSTGGGYIIDRSEARIAQLTEEVAVMTALYGDANERAREAEKHRATLHRLLDEEIDANRGLRAACAELEYCVAALNAQRDALLIENARLHRSVRSLTPRDVA